ncbi:MAG: hypothetical protein AMXMBFR66_13510 [Pseudomonadota bacterium]|nr:hypothetical protein [Rubrivivax sp.]
MHRSSRSILWTIVLAGAAALPVQADAGWSGNASLASHYRFRGIDQTWGRPALQAGIDWSHASGWYAGAWGSNVSRRSYPGGSVELDLYGGFNGRLDDDWNYTFGVYGYAYPGANLRHARCPSAAFEAPCSALDGQRYETVEINAGASWRWLTYKLSLAATDYFGASTRSGYGGSTRGTRYHDFSATVPLHDALSLSLHVGLTDLPQRYGAHKADYVDWRLAVGGSFEGGWTASIGVVGASNDRLYRPPGGGLSATDGARRALNRNALVVQVGRTF